MPQSSTSTGLALMHGALVRPQAGRDVADVAGHAGNADRLAARLGLDLLEIEHRRKRMASHPDQRAAAGHRPLRGVRGMRAGMALLALHEQDLVFGGLEDLHGLGHRRRVDPVLGIHEEPAGLLDRRAGRFPFPPARARTSALSARACRSAPCRLRARNSRANGFSQITCLPACIASTIIEACRLGGVQMSMTSSSASAIKSRKLRYAVGIWWRRANSTT